MKSCKDPKCLENLRDANGTKIVVISIDPTVLLSVGNDLTRGTVDDVVLVDERVFFIKEKTMLDKIERTVLLNPLESLTVIFGVMTAFLLIWQSKGKKRSV
jgi:hypothetical protein